MIIGGVCMAIIIPLLTLLGGILSALLVNVFDVYL